MKTWKKNLVAAAVLVTVCTGIYVNWLYTEQTTANILTDTLDAENIIIEPIPNKTIATTNNHLSIFLMVFITPFI